jgi:hypothetical protein
MPVMIEPAADEALIGMVEVVAAESSIMVPGGPR